MSYDRPNDAEYGGGGSGSGNYYDSGNNFDNQGGDYGKQGGAEFNTGGGYGRSNNSSGGYGGDFSNNDWSGAQQHAEQHAGDSGSSSLFGSVLSHLQNNSGRIQQEDIDENQAVQAHQQLYGGQGQGGGSHSSQSLGAAAAMQALKMFTHQGQGQGGGLGGGAHDGQNQFVGQALAEASRLFDTQSGQGNVDSSVSKQSAVASAGEMAMKMYLKSQMGGGGGGLMSIANKFM